MSDPSDFQWIPPEGSDRPIVRAHQGGVPKESPRKRVWYPWIAAALVLSLGICGGLVLWSAAPSFFKSNAESLVYGLAISTAVPIGWALFYSDKKLSLPRASDALAQLPPLAAIGILSLLGLILIENERLVDELNQTCAAVNAQTSPGDRAKKLNAALNLRARLEVRFFSSATTVGEACKGLLAAS